MRGAQGTRDATRTAERDRLCHMLRFGSVEVNPSRSPLMSYTDIGKILKVTSNTIKNVIARGPVLPD